MKQCQRMMGGVCEIRGGSLFVEVRGALCKLCMTYQTVCDSDCIGCSGWVDIRQSWSGVDDMCGTYFLGS